MDDKETNVFDLIEGLKPVDPNALADFERVMTEEVIPEIVRVVEQRRLFVAESRLRQLKSDVLIRRHRTQF